MKKFQFNLDTVLRYKQQVLDNMQNEYAAALARVRDQEGILAALEGRYRELNAGFREAETAGITVADAMGYEMGLRVLEGEIQRAEVKLEQLRQEAEERRLRLVAARQDAAALEKLREHQWDDYQKAVQKQEEQFIDELVSNTRAAASLS